MNGKKQTIYRDILETPLGSLSIVSNEDATLKAVLWDTGGYVEKLLKAEYRDGFELVATHDHGGLTTRLAAYFDGHLDAIGNLPVAMFGTAFQKNVWRALQQIPTGATTSYGQIAAQLGVPSAARAVGLANGSNPISIVVPCHRVIGANGSLTGYGGGLERKAWLLKHEGCLLV